jgi:hypothetical protein
MTECRRVKASPVLLAPVRVRSLDDPTRSFERSRARPTVLNRFSEELDS